MFAGYIYTPFEIVNLFVFIVSTKSKSATGVPLYFLFSLISAAISSWPNP